MKRNYLAALVATCFALPALAQSSVTVYGIADAGLMKTVGAPLRIVSGIADGSRLGFKGTEDLGGGYKTIFTLESRIEMDTGSQKPTLLNDNQGYYLTRGMSAMGALLPTVRTALQPSGAVAVNPEGALFDRTAMVGVITPVGAVLIGRMYTPAYEVFNAADVFEAGTAGQWGNITGGTAGFTALPVDIRSQKSIQYRIADPKSGLGGAFMYGAKGSGYLGRYNKFYGLNLVYKANGFDVGLGHNRGYDQGDNLSLESTILGGSYTVEDFKLFAGIARQKNDHSVLLGEYNAAWDLQLGPAISAKLGAAGPATVAALTPVYKNNIRNNLVVDATSIQVGMHYRVGAGRLMGSIARQNDLTTSNSDATQYSLGYDYNLSNRTDIYTVAAYIKNKNDAQYAAGAASAPGGFTSAPGQSSRALQVGIRHRF
ncbi:MAG: porin [Pseudomonadota bacterium]